MQPTPRRLLRNAPGIIALVTFGVLALAAVLDLAVPFAVIAVVGWIILTPLSAILGDVLLGEEDGSGRDQSPEATEEVDPLDRLRQRYAEGEIDEAEFERRLDLLLDTEDTTPNTARDRVAERND